MPGPLNPNARAADLLSDILGDLDNERENEVKEALPARKTSSLLAQSMRKRMEQRRLDMVRNSPDEAAEEEALKEAVDETTEEKAVDEEIRRAAPSWGMKETRPVRKVSSFFAQSRHRRMEQHCEDANMKGPREGAEEEAVDKRAARMEARSPTSFKRSEDFGRIQTNTTALIQQSLHKQHLAAQARRLAMREEAEEEHEQQQREEVVADVQGDSSSSEAAIPERPRQRPQRRVKVPMADPESVLERARQRAQLKASQMLQRRGLNPGEAQSTDENMGPRTRPALSSRCKGIQQRRQQDGAKPAAVQKKKRVLKSFEPVATALFDVDGKVLEMKLPALHMTPHDIATFWEEEWGVSYALRLRFEAPKGSPTKWINAHEDPVPTVPAEVRLHGLSSILSSLRLALVEHGGAANLPPEPPPKPLKGPECPGTYVRMKRNLNLFVEGGDNQALLRHMGIDENWMRGVPRGSAPESEEEDADEPLSEDARERRAAFAAVVTQRLEEEGVQRKEDAAEEVKPTFEAVVEEPCMPARHPDVSMLRLILTLCGFGESEVDDLIDTGQLKDATHFAQSAETQNQVLEVARSVGIVNPKSQALFAEVWRRCKLHLAGNLPEYPAAISKPIYEVDFAANALAYLDSIRAAIESEQFENASDEMIARWERKLIKPDAEERMEDVGNLLFDQIYSKLLAPFGFTPNKKGFKEAKAAVRQLEIKAVKELDKELTKAILVRFKF
mmetsp:Transcript_26975/g.84743  ORF Transcript_26975/g.84743 Transcript_26975/m.84743 type:complete len:730 (-) Transcript_26975:26-2215(-)